jgi:ribosomal protein S18 acetylase RimI-like enzyme
MGYGRRLADFFLTDLVHKGFERCHTQVKESNIPALNVCKKTGFYELERNGKYIILEKLLK